MNMTMQTLIEYCLKNAGAYLDTPFGPTFPVVKIKTPDGKGRIFAEIFKHDGLEKFTFGTDAETTQYLRHTYPNVIVRGYHCPPVQARYKSTVALSALPDSILLSLADLSYRFAKSKIKATS